MECRTCRGEPEMVEKETMLGFTYYECPKCGHEINP